MANNKRSFDFINIQYSKSSDAAIQDTRSENTKKKAVADVADCPLNLAGV